MHKVRPPVVLALFLMTSTALRSETARAPDASVFLGTWRVTSYERARSFLITDGEARAQVGKRFVFSPGRARLPEGFFGFGFRECAPAGYRWRLSNEAFVGNAHQALLPPDHPDVRPDRPVFLEVRCSDRGTLGLELTRSGRWMLYYGGARFFLERSGAITR